MSFWQKGYQALFITSFYKNPYMHTAGDTLDKVNGKFFFGGAQALVRLMVFLAND